jgi:hypothetical protein
MNTRYFRIFHSFLQSHKKTDFRILNGIFVTYLLKKVNNNKIVWFDQIVLIT